MGEVRFGKLESKNEASITRELRKAILPIMAVKTGGEVKPVGSCFIISCTGSEAIALTAKHNIDYIMNIDGAKPLHNPSTPKEFQVVKFNSKPINLKMYVAYFFKDEQQPIPCQIVKAWFVNDGPDIAVMLLRTLETDTEVKFTHRLCIDSKGPQAGEKVHIYGYIDMRTSKHKIDDMGVVVKQTLSIPLKYIPSEVQECYTFGEHHLVKWPCFKVNNSLDSGMSGGPVIYIKDDQSYVCV